MLENENRVNGALERLSEIINSEPCEDVPEGIKKLQVFQEGIQKALSGINIEKGVDR